MEGRDIGTVVFPDADVKVYLDASPEERARRRAADPAHGGGPQALSDVATALATRDRIDSTRAASPLTIAPDAEVIDTTGVAADDVVRRVLEIVRRETAAKLGTNETPEIRTLLVIRFHFCRASAVLVVLRRGRVQLPAVLVALFELRRALQLLIVFVLHAKRPSNLVDDVLVGRRVVAARRLVARAVGRLPVRVQVAARQRRAGFRVFRQVLLDSCLPGASRRGVACKVK